MEMYEIMEQSQIAKVDQAEVEAMHLRFRNKSIELKNLVSTRFKALKASLESQEQQVESILKKNLYYIDQQFQGLRNVPHRLIDDADRWLKTAKVKLDNFPQNSHNPHFIAFDMIDNKKGKGGAGEDFMEIGESIIS